MKHNLNKRMSANPNPATVKCTIHTHQDAKSLEQVKAVYRILSNKRDTSIQGAAGTGKTTLIKLLSERLKVTSKGRRDVIVLGTTGVASDINRGMTVHRFLSRKHKLCKPNSIVVIDEVSMMNTDLANKVWKWRRWHRERKHGDITLVFMGDMQQLPPVEGFPFYTSAYYQNLMKLGALNSVVLTKQHRIKDDRLHAIVNDIREIKWTPRLDEVFYGHYERSVMNSRRKLHVCGRNADVDAINKESFERSVPFPITIKGVTVGLGCPVMVTENITREGRLVAPNGMIGTVDGIDGDNKWVSVRRDDDRSKVIKIPLLKHRKVVHGNEKVVMPLKLAYAITVHKLQGATIKNRQLVIDFDNAGVWQIEQLYVLFTRCEYLDQLEITCKNIERIKRLFDPPKDKVARADLQQRVAYLDQLRKMAGHQTDKFMEDKEFITL